MELHKLISDILEGKARVLSFDNVACGPDKDITAGALSALNFARLAFAAEETSPVLSKILALLCSRKAVEVWTAFLGGQSTDSYAASRMPLQLAANGSAVFAWKSRMCIVSLYSKHR